MTRRTGGERVRKPHPPSLSLAELEETVAGLLKERDEALTRLHRIEGALGLLEGFVQSLKEKEGGA